MPIVQPTEVMTALGLTAPDPILTLITPLCEHVVFDWLRKWPTKQLNTEFYPINTERTLTADGPLYIDVKNGVASITPANYIVGDMLMLRNTPVWVDGSLEVREDYGARAGQTAGSFGSGTILTLGTHYWLDVSSTSNLSDSGILYRIGGIWPTEPGSVKVTYNGGWTQAQLNASSSDGQYVGAVKMAMLQTLVHNYRILKLLGYQGAAGLTSGPITSETLGPYSYAVSKIVSGEMEVAIPASAQRMLQPHRSYRGFF